MTSIETQEGYLDTPGGRVWYGIAGGGRGVPLLTLHGGPGFPHDYLEPLAALGDDRPVVFYDQLGCGRSDRPDDPSLWTLERFVEESAAVRDGLGLERIHLFGHSWGSMLAAECLIGGAPGVASLILASPILSARRFRLDAARLRAALPAEVADALARHEAAATTDSDDYQAATREYYRRHLWGTAMTEVPEPLMRSRAGTNDAVYEQMWGPNEFAFTGTLGTFERIDRLGDLSVPTLLICGRFDECTPEATSSYAALIPGAELVVFEQSAHMAQFSEPELYLNTVRDFLRRRDV